jgi:hypothetical protein
MYLVPLTIVGGFGWPISDRDNPSPPQERQKGRNHPWTHLFNADVISMPDKWEYPWYAAWDLAFHCIPLTLVDSDFAKEQLTLMLREWYIHPNGQIPALARKQPPIKSNKTQASGEIPRTMISSSAARLLHLAVRMSPGISVSSLHALHGLSRKTSISNNSRHHS